MTWQPIDTAEKDGTEILIWDTLGFVGVAYWDHMTHSWSDGEITYTPSHWMPLPKGPNQ